MSATESNKDKTSVLKTTRIAKGLTLEIVHEATKIPMDSLKAIEEGYSSRILSPFYYRGFIKIYAEFLGLDVGEMYKQYGLDQAPSPTTSTALPVKIALRENRPNPFLGQMQEGFSFILKPETLKLALKVIGFLVLSFFLIKTVGYIGSHMNKKAASARKQKVLFVKEKKQGINQVITHKAVQAKSGNNKVEVAVRAYRNTWLLVKADGHVVFETTLSKGSMESWSADKRIELAGRDIQLLDMEVNGKHIGPLGNRKSRIREVLITHEGLTVKK